MKELKKTLELDEASFHRNDDCKRYEKCLDDAAVKRWHSFSCIECQQYDPELKLTLRLRRASSLALA